MSDQSHLVIMTSKDDSVRLHLELKYKNRLLEYKDEEIANLRKEISCLRRQVWDLKEQSGRPFPEDGK